VFQVHPHLGFPGGGDRWGAIATAAIRVSIVRESCLKAAAPAAARVFAT